MNIFRDFEFCFDKDTFLARMPDFTPMLRRQKVRDIFEQVLGYVATKINPIGGWVQIPMLGIDHDKVVLEGGIKLGGGPVASFLVGSEYAIITACTIGTDFDNHLIHLQKEGKITEATMFDAIGSYVVSNARDQLEFEIVNNQIEKGMKHTSHLEPGSTDWDIKEQAIVFSLIDGDALGIRLSDSMMMYPSKSVTSMFGIGRGKLGIEAGQEIKCQYCKRRDRCEAGKKTMEKYPSKIPLKKIEYGELPCKN